MKPPLTRLKMIAFDLLVGVEFLFQPDPAFLAARLFAGEHRFPHRVFDALEIDLDIIADRYGGI